MNDLEKVNELINILDDNVKRSGSINEMLKNSAIVVEDLNKLKDRMLEVEKRINDIIANLNYSVDFNKRYLTDIKDDFNKIKNEILTKEELNKLKEENKKHFTFILGILSLITLLILIILFIK